MDIDHGTLERVSELYHAGLCLQAYRVAEACHPLPGWRGTDARLIAGRVAWNVGSLRLARAMHWMAWRGEPNHPEAQYYYARLLMGSRGPLAAWEFVRSIGDEPPGADSRVTADWLALHGSILCTYRDGPAANDYLKRAEAVEPQRAWIWVERATYHETFDQYDAAIEAARHALSLRPMYRPAVQALAHLLVLCQRDDEALELLTEATTRLESAPLLMQLAALQDELGQYEAARQSYERVPELAPACDKHFHKWLSAARGNAAYKCGDLEAAVAHARETGDDFFKDFINDPGHPGDGRRRVQLAVPFVRQHHKTCAPATLSTLSRFWDRPAEHLEIAERICFDGTPAHSERHWAESHGYLAPEFTVTWDAAVALIDRGIPFTLTTIEPGNGHLQAVIGYDSRRRTLLLRDPFVRGIREMAAGPGLEHYRSSGPRGMVMLPEQHSVLLEGIELPDRNFYDDFYQVQRALEVHDRPTAAAAVARMVERDANHRLTLDARRTLAGYDGDVAQMLAINDQQLSLFPDDDRLKMSRISLLRDLARQDQRLAELRDMCRSIRSDPLLHLQYAQELMNDARQARSAERRLRWVLRRRPNHSYALHALAGVLWDDPARRDQSLQLYRLAASADDKDEYLAMTYFTAARMLGRPGEVLAFLRWRFAEHGVRSADPAMTLFRALEEMDAITEAFAVQEEALARRPDDGALLLHAADARGRYGQFERASELLNAARGRSHEVAWLRTAAALATYRGELSEALRLWQRIAELNPLAVDAHRNIAQLLAETDGRAAAREHLSCLCERFPHHLELHRLRIEWLREEPADAEPVLRHLLDNYPTDAWAVRELGHILLRLGRSEEARQQAQFAEELEPQHPAGPLLVGLVHVRCGELDAARQAYRRALSLSIDFEPAMTALWELCDSGVQRREATGFIVEELKRQVMQGDGLLLFRRLATGTLPREEITAIIDQAYAARPQLWQTNSARIRQLAECGKVDEAHALAEQTARERFPLLPGAWLDLANTCRLRGDGAGRIAALQQALLINPRWAPAVRLLADAQRDAGQYEAAQATLERGIALCPTDAGMHTDLAIVLWALERNDSPQAALARLQHALKLESQDERAWDLLVEWSAVLKQPEVAEQAARELVQQRGGDAGSWLILARVLPQTALNEKLEALDKAIALDPRCWDAYDHKAVMLAEAGRLDEALAACQPAGDGAVPITLRGRAAWVWAQRHELRRAIALMEAALTEDPGYAWGWRLLGHWYQALGETEQHTRAAQALAELMPHDPVVQCDLAEARLQNGDRSGAKSALRRAMELDPTYGRAAMTLFDLQLEDGQLDELPNLLDALSLHIGNEWVTARRIQYLCAKGEHNEALAAFAELARSETEGDWPLQAAVVALLDHCPVKDIGHIVHETLTSEGPCHEVLAALWIHYLRTAAGERRRTLREARQRGGPVYQRALRSVLYVLADQQLTWPLRWLLWRNSDLLKHDTEDWATVGHVLVQVGLHRRCVRWMSDWAQRPVEPWMLLNLARALRDGGNDAAAEQVSQAALQLRADECSDCHALWLAAGCAARGEIETAQQLLDNVRPGVLDAYYTCLHEVVKATTEVCLAPADQKAACFARVRGQLRSALRRLPRPMRSPALRKAVRGLTRRIAVDRGGMGARLWHWMQNY